VQSLFPAIHWSHATYSTTVPGEHVDIDLRDFREVDNRMAAKDGQRKYLPYLMVNMLGEKRPA
jgi:hypothetical protein